MDHGYRSTAADPDSRRVSAPSPIISSPHEAPSWWHLQIMQALEGLRTGQILNRKSSTEQLESLRDHMDTRMEDLREDVSDRMDRIETRVATIEQRQAHALPWFQPASATASTPPQLPQAVPTVPAAVASAVSSPSTTPPLPQSAAPPLAEWLRSLSPREWLAWIAAFAALLSGVPARDVWALLVEKLPLK